MARVSWTTRIHEQTIRQSAPLLASLLGLQLQARPRREGIVVLREGGTHLSGGLKGVTVWLRWDEAQSAVCHLDICSEEKDHLESTHCWEVALQLRRLLSDIER
jgi:hypothetical protein